MKVYPIGIMQGRLIEAPAGQLQWFPQERWEDEFRIASEIGLNFIELTAERVYNPLNPIWTDEGCARILALTAKYGLISYSFCNNFFMEHSLLENSELLEQNFRLLNRGKLLGMKKLVLPFFEKNEITVSNLEKYVPLIQLIADKANELGISIGLETSLNVPELKRLLKGVERANVHCVFDIGNRVEVNPDAYAEIIELGDAIQHVHLKDKNSACKNVLFGTGNVDFQKAFGSLGKIGYSGGYTFETDRGRDPIRTCRYHKSVVDFFAAEVS